METVRELAEMTAEPSSAESVEAVRRYLEMHPQNRVLAAAYAEISNKTAWMKQELNEEHCPPEYGETYRMWCEFQNSLCLMMGEYPVFMEQNGYSAENGWWIQNRK